MPQYTPEDLVSFTDAAREKDCGRNTLYRAAHRNELTTVDVSGRTMIVQDEAYNTWEPEWTGARAQQDQDTSDD